MGNFQILFWQVCEESLLFPEKVGMNVLLVNIYVCCDFMTIV